VAARLLSLGREDPVQFINLYLIGYVILIVGGVMALWYAGMLQAIAPAWIVIGLVIAVGLGIMLSVSAGKPPTVSS
jgi:hypothetical protein